MTTPEGFTWTTTDDAIANGKSEASIARGEPGANGSTGALEITAKVKGGFPFPWAGASLAFSEDFNAGRSLENFETISFDVRGAPGIYRAMFFNAGEQGVPPTVTFSITEDWRRITLNLTDFSGLSANYVSGFALVAGPELGEFIYMVDNVRFE